MNYYPLFELADVQTGITLRGANASRHQLDGTHHLIRIGEVSDDGILQIGEPNLVKFDATLAARYTLRSGDVLLAARGTRMTATVFDGVVTAVAGGQFCVIRPKRDCLLPDYLRWFLNLSTTQEVLNALARGTYVRSLPAKSLATLSLPVPPIPQQRAIADLHNLRLHEKGLMVRLANLRATLVDGSLVRSLQS